MVYKINERNKKHHDGQALTSISGWTEARVVVEAVYAASAVLTRVGVALVQFMLAPAASVASRALTREPAMVTNRMQ